MLKWSGGIRIHNREDGRTSELWEKEDNRIKCAANSKSLVVKRGERYGNNCKGIWAHDICLRKGNLIVYLNDDGRDQGERDSVKKQDKKVELLVHLERACVFRIKDTCGEKSFW